MDRVHSIVERAARTASGFKDLEKAAEEVLQSEDLPRAKALASALLDTDSHQARCVATFVLGGLAAADTGALAVLRDRVSGDGDWRVQEILAKAFDRFCADTGYDAALPVIREWLGSPCANVRRAVTEGLRIWTGRPFFRDHPQTAIDLLAALRNDQSDYVRRSVGNALRDISKKHPDLIAREAARWDRTQPGVRQTWTLATRLIDMSAEA
jgi:3-methyladenine DNA glycosylase AlkD